MSIQSYQSKIIDPLMGPFPTVHDYYRLDLDETNRTFKTHRYYIVDGGGQQYTRRSGTYEMSSDQPEAKKGKITLRYQKSASLPSDLDESLDFYERFKEEENIYEVEKMLDNVIGLYLSFDDEDLEQNEWLGPQTEEVYTYKVKYSSLEIKTNEKPFGSWRGIYKKIQPYHITGEPKDMPGVGDCGSVIHYFCEEGKLEQAKKYFEKYFELMEKEDKKQVKESLQEILEKKFDYEFAKKYTKYTQKMYPTQ